LPRAALMMLTAGIVLPLAGFDAWAWRPPSGVAAALLFVPALALMIALGRLAMERTMRRLEMQGG
jgi:ABC-2 type transport system permease protein